MCRRRVGLRVLIVLAALLGATGCSGVAADRSGADTLLLRMATIDGYDFGAMGGSLVGPETFVHELEELSGGRIEVEVSTSYGMGAADAESRLVEAIAVGDVDGGWPATRAFADAGVDGLQAVEAPLTLVNPEAVAEVVQGEAAGVALDSLDGSGVVGVGLAAGGLRRPFATRALSDVESWEGARLRVFNSPVQTDAVAALGGEPLVVGPGWADEVATGRLDGAEFSLEGYVVNGYGADVSDVALNVVLWPKVFVLAMSEERFDSLDSEQQAWVAEAASRATSASVGIEDDDVYVDRLCEVGLRFHLATAAELDGLRSQVEPVLQGLREDAETAPLMEVVDAAAGRHPVPDTPAVPDDCSSPWPDDPVEVPTEVSAVPDGVYRAEIPVQAVADARVNNEGGFSGTWTLEVRDGVYDITCRPLDMPGKDCGGMVTDAVLEAGRLTGGGDVAYFVADPELLAAMTGCTDAPDPDDGEPCMTLDTYRARWRVEGGELVFSDNRGPASDYLVLRPWVRVASTR